MPSNASKLKILYLKDYLLQNSDEEHPVTMENILSHLESLGISAERKSIYRYLECLGSGEGCYGLDIISDHGKYFVGSRDFTPEEIRLLADMVQSSSFITQKKTESLISKLKRQTSTFEAKKLQRTIHVHNRIKNMNESVYLNIDRLSDAIFDNKVIQFKYTSYNTSKEKVCKYNGKVYVVSPYSLISGENTYLLIGYSHEHRELRMYRVDRMKDVVITDEPRLGDDAFEKAIAKEAPSKMFHMFTGDLVNVKMRFSNNLIDSAIDRFGQDMIILPDGDNCFITTSEVAVSPQFFSWIAGFDGGAEIIGPESVRNGMRNFLQSSLNLYLDK